MNKENWNHLSISECADVIGGGTPSTKNPDYWDGNIPWIAPKDLSNNKDKYISNGERFITQIGLEKSSAKLLPENSLLFSSRAPIGYLAINTKPVATNQGFKSLILKDGFDVEFFYYLFKNKTEYIKNFASGSTFQEVSGSVVKNLSFLIPPKQEQKRISNILSKLDKKIELNQQMNEILEEIAKTLFKSWFIDFDPVRAKAEGRPTGLSKEISDLFPDSFEDSELGEIPKGWRIESFSNITSFKNGFAFKSKDWTESGKPVVKIGNVKPLILDIDGCSFISDDIKKYDEYLLSKGDILIGMTGYVGETCLVPKLDKMPYQNQRVGKLIPTKDFFKEFIFSFTRQSNFKKKVEEIAKGSAQQNVSGKDILGLHFVFGNEEILKIFSDSTSDLFKKILLNFEENITLAKVRDTLLPKLISGELKILDAENLIEEAGI